MTSQNMSPALLNRSPRVDAYDLDSGIGTLSFAIRSHARPPPDIFMGDWCEENIYLPRSIGTPFPGPYRMNVMPWVRGWFEAFQSPDNHTVVIKKGAQVAATQTCYCAGAFWVCEDPDPILLVMPAADEVKATVRNRIRPMFRESKTLAEQMTGEADDMTLTEFRMRLTFWRFVGSNSPSKLASFAHRYLMLDETDKYKERIGSEGSVTGLAMKRTRLFWNRKRILTSSPSVAGGYINRYFLRGDQRVWEVPCPKCGHYQVLRFRQVKFDSSLPPAKAGDGAYYECENKGCKISNADKDLMVARGRWTPTAEAERRGVVSFDMPGIYSSSDECTFSALAEEFLSVKDNKAELQDFVNSTLGEVWKDQPVVAIGPIQVYSIRDRNRYARGTVPTKERVYLILVADVQASYIVWTVWALGARDIWLVDHGLASVIEELPDKYDGPYTNAAGKESPCQLEAVDSGYRTTEVYRYCAKRPRAMPLKGDTGQGTRQTMPVRYQKLDRMPDGRPIGRSIILRHIHPTYFKDELVELMKQRDEEQQIAIDAGAVPPLTIHFHEEVDRDYAEQVTGEVPMETNPDVYGNTRRYYKKIRANHFFDCAQYALAIRWIVRRDIDRLQKKADDDDDPTPEATKQAPRQERRRASYDGVDEDD